jgi:hypothetical protein
MTDAIKHLERSASDCEHNAPISEAAGDVAQAELDRRLAEQYRQAARHLKAVES